MVPFDEKSPFVTSGIRVGTPAITTRGLEVGAMDQVVDWMDQVIMQPENEVLIQKVRSEVQDFMHHRPLFKA